MTSSAELDRALGWSLKLAPLDPIDGAAGGLDLAFGKVTGADALAQSLTLAFVTLKGSDLFNGSFGFSGLQAIADEADPVLRRERIRMSVLAVLQQEPRVRRIVTVRFADENGTAAPAPGNKPGERSCAIEAIFETIGGVQRQIILGGEVLDVR